MIVKRKERQINVCVGPDGISEKDFRAKAVKNIIQ
jgi:hypothetical protein